MHLRLAQWPPYSQLPLRPAAELATACREEPLGIDAKERRVRRQLENALSMKPPIQTPLSHASGGVKAYALARHREL